MVIRRGEIWWADLPAPQGSESGYRRPVLVVQDDFINRSTLRTILVIPLSSELARSRNPDNVPLPAGATGLPKDSVLLPTLLSAIDKAAMSQRVGTLPRRWMEQVDLALLAVLGLAGP